MRYTGSGSDHGLYALTLKAQHVQALCDGQFFLEHLPILHEISVEPRCHGCGSRITVTETPARFEWRCQHRQGWVARDRFLEVAPLLMALEWGLRCTRCHGPIDGENAPTDATFLVSCRCAIRSIPNPAAQGLSTASGRDAMAGVGHPEPA